MARKDKSTHKEGRDRGKRVPSLPDLEPYSTSASSSDDTSPERRKRRRRRTPSSRNAKKNEDLLTCSQDNKILDVLKSLNAQIDKLSKQSTENKDDNSEMCKLLEKVLENQNVQNKELEKVVENQNVLRKELEKLRKQSELHTNGTSHASDAPRSQSNQLQPPRYRLEFTSGKIHNIEKGQTIDISVALVDCNNNQTVENGPLASATVELVVVNAEFNEHDNQHNWSREDFERYMRKPRCRNKAKGDVDRSGKSIVSKGQFKLVHGANRYNNSTIFENSSNTKVRLGVMVVLPTDDVERVLEGVSNPFIVRGHDRPARQNNLRQNSSTRQNQALVGNDYQEQRNGLDITSRQSQRPFPRTTMLPTIPSTGDLPSEYHNVDMQWEVEEIMRQSDTPFNANLTTFAVQLVWDRPNVEPSKRHWNLLDQLMPLPKFNNCCLPTTRFLEMHLDPLTIISKEVMQTRRNRGVIIELLEPDDSDEERQLKRKMCSKYKLRFVNKVCEAYHTRDPIKADDGSLLNVALFDENNRKITYGPLSSASVQIVVLHGDFNDHGQDYWTSEEFSRYEVCPRPGEEASSVLGGNCILVLADGEACLGDAFFQMTSYCARTGKFKMGVRLASTQEERIQEGVSEPFSVKDRHFAGECGRVTGIWPEDDTARINHSLEVQEIKADENMTIRECQPHKSKMANIALGSVGKIVEIALKIKEAVETVKQNEKECHDIQRYVARVSALLRKFDEMTETMKDEVMRDALEDLAESLERALELVTECQQKHIFRRFFGAGDKANELGRVQDDIMRKLQLVTNILSAGGPPPPPPPQREVIIDGLDIIGGQSQLPFSGTNMLSTELSIRALIPAPYLDPDMPSVAQAICRQNGQALVDNDYQQRNNPMPNLPHPSPINAGNKQPLLDNDSQEQNSPMPNLPHPSPINSNQTAGNGLDIIGGRSQLPFPGTNMLSTEPSTSSLAQYYADQSPHRARHFGSEPCSAMPPEESATMKKKIIIRVEMTCHRRRAKAFKLVAATPGVISIELAGDARDQLVVVGHGVDSIRLASALRRKVGPAEIVQVVAEAKKEGGGDKKPPAAGYEYGYQARWYPQPDIMSVRRTALQLAAAARQRASITCQQAAAEAAMHSISCSIM